MIDNIDKIDAIELEKYFIGMADLEFRLSSSTFDDIYIASLVGIFKL